jgi:hypothetical protein
MTKIKKSTESQGIYFESLKYEVFQIDIELSTPPKYRNFSQCKAECANVMLCNVKCGKRIGL